MTLEVLILTKSSKNGGFCVAGIDMSSKKWIRLVSDDKKTDGALTAQDCSYANNRQMEVLDLVSVKIKRYYPSPKQPENYLIDRNYQFERKGKYTINQMLKLGLRNQNRYILGNLQEYIMDTEWHLDHSLELVEVANFETAFRQNRSGQWKLKANFEYQGRKYANISVTDPEIHGTAKFERAVLVLSVANQPTMNGAYYKFIAKCFPLESNSDTLSYDELDYSEIASANTFHEKYKDRLSGPLVLVKTSGSIPWYGDYCFVIESIDDNNGNVCGTTYKNGAPYRHNERFSSATKFKLYQGDSLEKILSYYR